MGETQDNLVIKSVRTMGSSAAQPSRGASENHSEKTALVWVGDPKEWRPSSRLGTSYLLVCVVLILRR